VTTAEQRKRWKMVEEEEIQRVGERKKREGRWVEEMVAVKD
jgi:hypothetical protein